MTHPLPVAGKLPIKSLVAKQLPSKYDEYPNTILWVWVLKIVVKALANLDLYSLHSLMLAQASEFCFLWASDLKFQILRSVKAGSDGVYTTKMAKHGGTNEEKYKVTATNTHLQVCMKNKVY